MSDLLWQLDEIVDAAAAGLRRHAQRLRREQAVYGLDALSEVELHPILEEGLADAGLGVLRETPYPSQWRRKVDARGPIPLARDRERCDLVLTPRPGQRLRDSLWAARQVEAAQREAEGTLFAPAPAIASAGVPDIPDEDGLSPDEVYWLEVKAVGQHTLTNGIMSANSSYSSELLGGPVRDLQKLSRDGSIMHAGLLLVHFAQDEATATHDLGVFRRRCIERVPALAEPSVRAFPIDDRIGNRLCAVMLAGLLPKLGE
jgi:hypothetical protein